MSHDDGVNNDVVIRPVKDDELTHVAELRWQSLLEFGGTPDTTHQAFVDRFVTWVRDNAASHRCLVVVRSGDVIGAAWLAVTPRVPSPAVFERATGDLQSVYVVPHERNSGLGGRLIDAILQQARELGLERVTVHSSDRAFSVYVRHGFAASTLLLQAVSSPPDHPATPAPCGPQ